MMEIGLAIGVASKSFTIVKKMVAAGRDLEDTVGQLSAWFGAISDINEAERQIKNPPLFRKLTNSKSVEQEAIEIFAAKREAMAQKELREVILYVTVEAWREMIALRRRLGPTESERSTAKYAGARLGKQQPDGLAIAILLAATIFCLPL